MGISVGHKCLLERGGAAGGGGGEPGGSGCLGLDGSEGVAGAASRQGVVLLESSVHLPKDWFFLVRICREQRHAPLLSPSSLGSSFLGRGGVELDCFNRGSLWLAQG